ncbi:type IV pilus biogenesis/stability protein PilW [Neisseriaceae bacterium B1]
MVLPVTLVALGACVQVGPGSNLTKFKDMSRKERKEENAKIKTQQAMAYYTEMRDFRAAVSAIEEAVQSNPSYDMAWLVRAQIYQALKTYDKAEQSFMKALSISPNSAEINNNYGWYICSAKKQPNAAIAYFDRALADPTYPQPEVAYLNKGICTAKAGQANMADAYFERALAMNPEFSYVYKEQARAKLESDNTAEADRLFRIYQSRVDALSPDDLLLGWKIARAQGQLQNAYEYEAQLRANFPHSEELQSISTGKTE